MLYTAQYFCTPVIPELRKVGFLAECFECRAVFGAEGAHVHLVAVADFGCVDMIGSLEDEAAHNLVAGKVDGSPGCSNNIRSFNHIFLTI